MTVKRRETDLLVTFSLTSDEEETIPVRAQFIIPIGKGLLGPSANPGDQHGFANRNNTVFALNNQPVTKSSYVYVFVREGRGGIRLLDNVNRRIAKLLPRDMAELAKSFLRVERIDGRELTVQTVDFLTAGRPSYEYLVEVADDGSLRLR